MPLELGIFLGAKKFGIEEQKRKKCLVLDTERYRFQQFISDIAGQDIQSHNNSSREVIMRVRNWLRTASRRETIPSGSIIWERYQEFIEKLPQTAREARLIPEELIFKAASSNGQKSQPTTFKVGRDTRTGRFISRKEAERRKTTAIVETITVPKQTK